MGQNEGLVRNCLENPVVGYRAYPVRMLEAQISRRKLPVERKDGVFAWVQLV